MPRIFRVDDDRETKLLIREILKKQGRDFTKCEMCKKDMSEEKSQLHHTKYEGATMQDLMIVCAKCNTQTENKYLV